MTEIQLSPQQEAVCEWVRAGDGSAFVEAVAGSGKTFTLIAAVQHMEGSVAMAAFNKSIADEISGKISLPNVTVRTFHSYGFAAWRKVAGNVNVDARLKWRQMMEENEVPDDLRVAIGQMVSIAKQSVIDPELPDLFDWQRLIDHFDIMLRVEDDGRDDQEVMDDLIGRACQCIGWSFAVGQTIIDFDDMIWLPLVGNVPIRQYDWVLVDEAQDTNVARRMLAAKMLKPGGRSVWVGDRHQAIYGFTGADSNAVDLIIKQFGCTQLPLTVTYRCSKAATEFAQQWVPHIEAYEANAEGSVQRVSRDGFLRQYVGGGYGMGQDDNVGIPPESPDRLSAGDVILCRLNRPLVELAFRLLREGIGCHVEGRDIGKQLDSLAGKWKVNSAAALAKNLEAYRQRETEKLVARKAEYAIAALNDRIETLFVIMDGCETVREVRDKIDRLFKDSNGDAKNTVVLSSVHKAKGREWDRVFILGFERYMPSRWAHQPWELEQEGNLCYVAATRTKSDLILTAALEA